MAQRASAIARIARGSTDDAVRRAVSEVDDLLKADGLRTGRPWDPKTGSETYRWADEFERKVGAAGRPVIDEAMNTLSTRQRALVTMRPVVETLARASEVANAPFGIFGKDGAAGLVMKRFAQKTAQGALSAFDIGKVANIYRGVADPTALNESVGTALSFLQRSMAQDNLVRMVRTRVRDENGGLMAANVVPDTLSNPERAIDAMRTVDNPLEAQQSEIMLRRWRTDYIPNLGGLEGEARRVEYDRQMGLFREQAAAKLAHAGKMDIEQARTLMKNADADELAFADWAYFGRIIMDLKEAKRLDADNARTASRQLAADMEADPKDTAVALARREAESLHELTVRATLVGPSELTMQQATDLLAKLDAADEATAVSLIEEAIATKEYLYQSLYEATRITNDAALVAKAKALLKDGIENERFVTVLNPDTLPANLRELYDRVRATGGEYDIGMAPAMDKRWAPQFNENGNLIGYRPWMEIEGASTMDVQAPTRFDVLRDRLLKPIRGENMLQETRRKFISAGVKEFGLDRASANTVWEAVRTEAREVRITMRGFSPEEFRRILDRVRIPDSQKQALGYRDLARLTAIAMEGDLKMVGLTSKLTGKMKTKTAAYDNYIGQLAERIYPLIRFKLNPVFLMQEFVEPYFFNLLRGVKPGFKFTASQVEFHALLDEWNMAEHLADGFEAREFMMTGAIRARNGMGPNTPVAAATDPFMFGRVGTPKRMNYYNVVKRQFGDMLYDAFNKQFPGQWTIIESFFNDLDVKNGGHGRLSRGDVAERWFKQKGMYDPDQRATAINHYDGATPDALGRVVGIRRSHVAERFGYKSGDEMRRAALDPNDPLNEWGVRGDLVDAGFTPEYAERAWQTITGISPEELYDSVRSGYADPVVADIAVRAMEQWHAAIAVSKGISLDEYIARKFTSQSIWLNQNGKLPYNAHPQAVGKAMAEWGWVQIEPDDERTIRVRDRGRAMMHSLSDVHGDQNSHVNHAANLDVVGSAGVPEGKGRVVGRVKVGDITLDLDVTPDELRTVAEEVLGKSQVAGAGDWYRYIPSMYTSLAYSLDEATVRGWADLMNKRMKSVDAIDMGDLDAIREEVAARMLMAFSVTQINLSPRAGFANIMKLADQELRGKRPGDTGVGMGVIREQLDRVLRDFEDTVQARGMGVKIHDFTDSNLGLTERTFMRNPDGTLRMTRQPAAADIWASRAIGFLDEPAINYLAKHLQQKMPGLTDEQALAEVYRLTGLDPNDLRPGSPTIPQYEWVVKKYNEVKDRWNDEEYLFAERGGRPWTAPEVQAVDWLRFQKQVGNDPDTAHGMIGKNVTDVQFEFRPSDHIPLRTAFDLQSLDPDAADHVTRTIAQDLADIVQEETGVTILRYQPGWGNVDGITSGNTSWSLLGSPDVVDDALDVLSLLTQNSEILATNSPGILDVPISSHKTGRYWAIDFAPVGGADARTMEALRTWLDRQARAGNGFTWEGSMGAMRANSMGEAVRSIYRNVPDGLYVDQFAQAAPVPQAMLDALQTGEWATEVGLDPIPVAVEREMYNLKSRKHDYAGDERRAQKRIDKGEAADAVYAEEMGRKVQAALSKRGKEDVRQRVVGGHLAAIRARADTAIQRADAEKWAAGRGRLQLLGEAGRDIAEGTDSPYHQYSPRGFRAAVAWDRGRRTNERVARGGLSGRRGTLYLKKGMADVTSPIHETFHFMADDLDPSAVRAIHDAWWKSLTKAEQGRFTEPTKHNVLVREAEEWMAHQFEEYSATGITPGNDPTMAAVFNQYAQMWQQLNPGKVAGAAIDPRVQAIFDSMNPQMHRGPSATFHVDEYRMMEAARIALQRAEDEAFRVHYYKRGRGLLERSINHPYLGLYPASYMWGKVLPELIRFLVRKPFGVDAPFAGLQMANHVYEAIQLELNTDDGTIKNMVAEFPELLRFLQLMVPGTPWDIPVNAPAWTRRLAQSSWEGKPADPAAAISDTVMYAFGPGRAPRDLWQFGTDVLGLASKAAEVATGQYRSPEERLAETKAPGYVPPAPPPPRLRPEGVIQ
jgi:hypothetical protein